MPHLEVDGMVGRLLKTRAGSTLVGKMPRGCQLCIRGTKLVLFVTGVCRMGCFYCPLSEKRKGRDVVYSNERPTRSPKEIVEEVKRMDALGTGITGGDPSARFKRTIGYIRLLKSKFGEEHHIHMYCCNPLSREKLAELKGAGLDEVRFHVWSASPVKLARDAGIDAGVELPVLPGSYSKFTGFFRDLDKVGCDFVNMNELEFSDTNLTEFKQRGFKLKPGASAAVDGSERTAMEVLRWGAKNTGLNIHYCPSTLKDSVQLRNRLKRTAWNTVKLHEAITEDGLLFKGVIGDIPPEKLAAVRRRLLKKHHVAPDLVAINTRKNRVELHWRLAEFLAEREPALKFSLVEEYPTHDGLETTVIPLKRKV
jgi:hypothetical protein